MNFKTLLLPLLLSISALAHADVIMVNNVPTIVKQQHTPQLGVSKQAVLSQFGEPVQQYTAPGKVTKKNPKISVWTYNSFKVYFENNHVIHSVVKQR